MENSPKKLNKIIGNIFVRHRRDGSGTFLTLLISDKEAGYYAKGFVKIDQEKYKAAKEDPTLAKVSVGFITKDETGTKPRPEFKKVAKVTSDLDEEAPF